MTIQGNGTSQTTGSTETSYSYSESYSTAYVSSTTYKVTLNAEEGGSSFSATAWILKNGTTVALNIAGENLTGSESGAETIGLFSGFIIQIEEDSAINQYTNTDFFHSTGTSTVSIGSTQVSVTTYAADKLPLTYSDCGVSTTLTAYSFSVGTPQGASAPLVVYENFAGSDTSGGQTTTFTYYSQVTAITLA